MRKFTIVFFSLMFLTQAALAGVRFIVDSPSHTKRDRLNSSYISASVKKCQASGYSKTYCPRGEQGVDFCPQNSRYFRYCCPNEYAYTKKECAEQGMRAYGSGCHGYYECRPDENSREESADFK